MTQTDPSEEMEEPLPKHEPSYRSLLAGTGSVLFGLSLVLFTLFVAARVAGASPWVALAAWWAGAFGDAYSISETLTRATPLLFTGLGVAIAFRCGVWNIGAEGQLVVGAMGAMALLKVWQPASPWIGVPALLLAGAAAGLLWAMLPALLLLYRRVPEVISTIMLNFVALQLLSWAIRGPLQETAARYPQSDEVPAALQMFRLMPPTRLHLGFILALVMVAVVSVLLYRTVLGFQIRATGQNERAARYAGISTRRTILTAMAMSGALAGLGGAVELTGVTFRVVEPFSPGYGFTAIAVALMGGLNPPFVGLAALLFGALEAGSSALQRVAGIPAVLVSVIQAVVLFFVAWQNAKAKR